MLDPQLLLRIHLVLLALLDAVIALCLPLRNVENPKAVNARLGKAQAVIATGDRLGRIGEHAVRVAAHVVALWPVSRFGLLVEAAGDYVAQWHR